MAATSEIFKKHQYISLETLRKTGQGVRTPVWFAQDGSTLYVWTDGTSGKAKRIRNNPQVKVAPSNQTGKELGEYVAGQALVYPLGSPTYAQGNQMMDKKYGLMKKIFEFTGRNHKASRVIIQIKLSVS